MSPRRSEDSILSPPIPSYDEATSASNPLLGSPSSIPASSRKYKPPHVRPARGSEDSLYDRDLNDDITELESDVETDQGVDDLDYQGVELDDLGTGARRQRRRGNKSGWKERFSDLRRRVSSWRLWQFNISFPSFPESWKNSSAIVARLFGLLTLIILGWAFFAFAIFPASQNELSTMFDLESVRAFAQMSVDTSQINQYLQHVTNFDHTAGTTGSFYLAEWMKGLFTDAGLDEVDIEEYQVYLNYPTKDGRRVAITAPEEMKYEAQLEEPQAYPDETLVGRANTYTYHGLSRSGTVSGPLIYFNYGSVQDYDLVCSAWAINCNGAVAIVRYHGTQENVGIKVKNAEKWGVKGVLIYSDPVEDGSSNGPGQLEERWRPADSVQRASVALMNWVVGDVLTPGWASKADTNRKSKDKNPGLVNIPSLPLSFSAAQPLLQALKGHGRQVPDGWAGGIPGVDWYSGDENSPTVLLQNEQEERERERIFNVMGKITGAETDGKTIIVGTHRDSWCFGAADP
jgi:N-acetylated-alpha-linked acidic dipeptidase